MKYKYIFFDLDGTLIDSRLDLAAAVNRMRKSFGLAPISTDTVVSYVGNGVTELVKRSIAGENVALDEAVKRMSAFYREHLDDETTVYPGVLEGLEKLRRHGAKLALLTNKPEAATLPLMAKLHVAERLDAIFGARPDRVLKPEPGGCLELMALLHADPAATLMVGDHYTDLECARRANIAAVRALWGYGDPRGEKAIFEAETFTDMVDFVLSDRQ